ncbi:MAG: hypothetical protein R3B68_14475 [Phycisphaerales bacterium]
MEVARTDPGEVRGAWCPACGQARGIRRERRTRQLDASDLVVAAIFGLIGAMLACLGRTSTRLRCPSCQCQFPEPMGAVRGFVLVTLFATVFGTAAYWLLSDVADEAIAWLGVAAVALLGCAVYVAVVKAVLRRWSLWRRSTQTTTTER